MEAQSVSSALLCSSSASAIVPSFEDGDKVVFLGDSITHSRKWHRYIADYYMTHFPERSIQYINAGISGDTAPGSLKRLDRDVLRFHPTVVVILLGMNDITGTLYSADGASLSVLQQRQKALETYKTAMRQIVARIQTSGVGKVILLSPSPYDDTSTLPLPNQMGKNQGLAQAGEFVRELAAQTHSYFVDFHGPITELIREQQAVDPMFSLSPLDRIHPGEPGNLLMAWLFLRAQGAKGVDTIHFAANARPECIGCSITNFAQAGEGWQFEITEQSLPTPFDVGARPALRWRPIEKELNAEVLRVDGVEPGNSYSVSIDGAAVGNYSAEALQTGVDLGDDALTPQYRQAESVVALDEQWRALAKSLRDVEEVRDSILIPAGKEDLSLRESAEFLQGWLKRQQPIDPNGARYYAVIIPKTLATMPHVAEIHEQITELQRQSHDAAVPKPHHVRIELSETTSGH